jgi:hypothetical protein
VLLPPSPDKFGASGEVRLSYMLLCLSLALSFLYLY